MNCIGTGFLSGFTSNLINNPYFSQRELISIIFLTKTSSQKMQAVVVCVARVLTAAVVCVLCKRAKSLRCRKILIVGVQYSFLYR